MRLWLTGLVAALLAPSPAAGGRCRQRRAGCSAPNARACHSSEPGRNKIGPSLFGVYGRAYGTAPGFRYPPASRDAAVVWNDESLDKYLTDPKSVLPLRGDALCGAAQPGAAGGYPGVSADVEVSARSRRWPPSPKLAPGQEEMP